MISSILDGLAPRALEAVQLQQARIAEVLHCTPNEIEAEVRRVSQLLVYCFDCGRLGRHTVCESCIESRRLSA